MTLPLGTPGPSEGLAQVAHDLRRCACHCREAARLEAAALAADAEGLSEEAVNQYTLAATELAAAAEGCPPWHQDKSAILAHVEDLQDRCKYLGGLCGSRATLPPDQHIAPRLLSVDDRQGDVGAGALGFVSLAGCLAGLAASGPFAALALAAGAHAFALAPGPAPAAMRACLHPPATPARGRSCALRMSDAGDQETQTNTGRFSSLVDFDHTGMDDKEFREKLKEKMGKIREKSTGNKGTLDYMAMLNGGAAPAEPQSGVWDRDDAAGGEDTPRRKSIWDK